MKNRKMTRHKNITAALILSLAISGTACVPARADVLEDAKEKASELIKKADEFLEESGVKSTLKNGYDTVTDFIFTYETQPDDPDMENLARSWAITTWLADTDKEESNVYYFDNHTLTMTEDLTQIGSGYNLSKHPDGSTLNGKHTGILKAVVKDATSYSVEWVNYDDEVNFYLMMKMKQKNASETEDATEAAQ